MTDPIARPVLLQPPGEGAYRITVVGSQSHTVARAFSAAGDPVEMQLKPDRYNAVIESVSTPGTTYHPFNVYPDDGHGATACVSLGADPDLDPSSALRALPRPKRDTPSLLDEASASDTELALREPEAPGESLNRDFESTGSLRKSTLLSRMLIGAGLSRPARDAVSPRTIVLPPALKTGPREFTVSLSMSSPADGARQWFASHTSVEPVNQSASESVFRLSNMGSDKWGVMQRLTVIVDGHPPLRIGVPDFPDGILVMMRPAVDASNPDLVVTMRPVNERTATLIGSLQRALPREVDELLVASSAKLLPSDAPNKRRTGPAAALEAFMRFDNDPWASIAAALLMVRTGQIADAIDLAMELGDRYSAISDAVIASAWATVAGDDGDSIRSISDAVHALIHARKVGPPYLAASNALAVQMLTTLVATLAASSDADPDITTHCQNELELWRARSRRAVAIGAFFGWELEPDAIAKLELHPGTDTVIFWGNVSARAVDVSLVTHVQEQLRAEPGEA